MTSPITSPSEPAVSKLATRRHAYHRPVIGFPSARAAFEAYIRACGLTAKDRVLLPSFIGWSAREGSGVFDPIQSTGLQPRFYRMTESLTVDVEDVYRQIQLHTPRMLVLIHYFGFPDPHAAEIARFAKAHDVIVVEDEAHAMLSDLVGDACGRWGNAAFISLHKMLPYSSGGALLLNAGSHGTRDTLAQYGSMATPSFWEQDLPRISKMRQDHYHLLTQLLSCHSDEVELLRPVLPQGVVPQTLPIRILRGDRNRLYFAMNESGFGVVSLYHTMIRTIDPGTYPEAFALAGSIMNLPVHQDASKNRLEELVSLLGELTS